jgi:hypothetical protein
MSANDVAPWDGPDLLADAKAAALAAGSSGHTGTSKSVPNAPPKEATWADFEDKPMVQETTAKTPIRMRLTRSVTPRDASGGNSIGSLGVTAVPVAAPVRSAAESEWWTRLKAENAVKAAKVASEKEAKKQALKEKAALKRGSLSMGSGRSRKPRGTGKVHILGAVTFISNGELRKRRTTMTAELSAAIAADTGTLAQVAERHGVSVGAVQDVRAKAGTTSQRRLTAPQVIEIWNSPENTALTAKRYQVSDAAVSFIRTGKTWGHLTSQLAPVKHSVKPRVARTNGSGGRRVRLDPSSMAALMADTGTHAQLSAKYGVSVSTVRRARARAKGGMTTI